MMSSVIEKVLLSPRCLVLPLFLVLTSCDFGDSDSADAGSNNSAGAQSSTVCLSAFSPCGGDLTGTWAVQAVCGVTNPVDTVNANFAAYPNCSGTCTGAAVTASGTKTYDSGSLTSSESFRLVETLELTSACFNDVMQTSLTDSTCQGASSQFNSASCDLSATGCGCQVTDVLNNDSTSYQAAGTSLTEAGVGNLLGSSVEYCVVGNTMTQRRQLPPGNDFVVTYIRR